MTPRDGEPGLENHKSPRGSGTSALLSVRDIGTVNATI
jgi:hypothetical protein